MVRTHLLDRRGSHDRFVAERARAERMAGRIRELAPRLIGHAPGVPLRLLVLGKRLGANELQALRREGGRDDGLRDQIEERVEVVGEALTGEDRRVQPHVEAG